MHILARTSGWEGAKCLYNCCTYIRCVEGTCQEIVCSWIRSISALQQSLRGWLLGEHTTLAGPKYCH